MHCPSCQQPLDERAPACPFCGFNLDAALREFGPTPALEHPLTDLASALGPLARRRVRAALLGMSVPFPQIVFAAVLAREEPQTALGARAFWLFNSGGLSAPREAGGLCRLVLLVLDVANQRAACMVGYGLEPFLAQEILDRIAGAALPGLQDRDPAAAVLAALESARFELAAVSRAIPLAFGLPGAKSPAPAAGGENAAFAY